MAKLLLLALTDSSIREGDKGYSSPELWLQAITMTGSIYAISEINHSKAGSGNSILRAGITWMEDN